MQALLELMGFTTATGVAWNLAAYVAFIVIIIGISSDRHRNTLTAIGAIVLGVYAWIFLHNPLFAALQALVVISICFQWAKLSPRNTVVTFLSLTALAYFLLAKNGAIADAWSLAGSFGLLGIAIGLIILPKKPGFLILAAGGVLLVVYGYHASAWVFFLLNAVYFVESMRNWLKK